jgi:hypothetical protein
MKRSMATPLAAEKPTPTLEFSNDLTNLHNDATVVRSGYQARPRQCTFSYRFVSEAQTTESVAHRDRKHSQMDQSVERSNVKRLLQAVLDANGHLSARRELLLSNDPRPVDRRPDYRQQGSSPHQRDETQIRCRRHQTKRIRLRTKLGHLDTPADPPTRKRPLWALPQRSSLLALSMTCQNATWKCANLLEAQPVHICLSTDDKSDFAPTYKATRTVATRVLGDGTSSPCNRIPSM